MSSKTMNSVTKKIVVLISGNGSNLQAIIDRLHLKTFAGETFEVVKVISNIAGVYGLERAKLADIDTQCVISKGVESREIYDQSLQAAIDQVDADVIVLAGFMRILSSGFVEKYSGKLLNIHPSLLPKYTGLNTHQRAINAPDDDHGPSVHFVIADLDAGPVIIQAKVPVFKDDSASELAERVLTQEHCIYPLAIQWFLTNRLKMQDGKALLDGNVLPENGYAAD
jgi:phosphoribosylglycinamide formyltransferase-1